MSPPNSTSRPEFAQDSQIDAILMDATGNDPSRNASSTKRSLLDSFLDSFFHPSNIRWLLVIGAAIVLASSVMLVSREWNHWHNAIKFLTILGYTGTIFVASQLARNRLGLPTTSEVLDGLTLLLLPLSTLALRWLTDQAGTGSALALGEHLSLLGLAIALTLLASRSIFDRWLRGRQPTFQMAYVALVAAGSLPILADPWWGAGFFGLIWAIMTIGAIKVNRHLFWLVEEHRLPRVFGFFPIALLGMEFLLLVISKTMHSIHLEWFGVGCTLVSITFLLTARSASNVYRQRMGGIDHALPIHLAVPLVVGLALLAAGAMLSLFGFHYVGPTTYAAVPNALMAAIILWLVAGDTRLSVFAWASLLCATFAYQSSPTLFSDLVSVLKSQAATAVQEDRLPLAFYGLTYLPWLVLLAVASRLPRVAARPEFSQPLRQLATVLGLLLFVVSLSHLKALFIVSLVDSLLFTFFALWWKDRRYLLVTLIASFVASASLVPFLHAMQLAHLHPAHLLTSISLWSIIMIVGGIHRWISSIPISKRTDVFSRYLLLDRHQQHRDLARSAGLFVSIAMPFPCIVLGAMNLAGTWDSNVIAPIAMTLLSLALYSWWTGTYWMGLFQSFVLASFTLLLFVAHGFDDPVSLVGLAMILPAIGYEWVAGVQRWTRCDATRLRYAQGATSGLIVHSNRPFLDRSSTLSGRFLDLFVLPISDLATILSVAAIGSLFLPIWVTDQIAMESRQSPLYASLVIAWIFFMAIRHRSKWAAACLPICFAFWSTEWMMPNSTINPYALGWVSDLPLLLLSHSIVFVLFLAGCRLLADKLHPLASSVGWWVSITLAAISFHSLNWEARCSVLLGVISFLLSWRRPLRAAEWTLFAILGHIQFFYFALYLVGIPRWIDLGESEHLVQALVTALLIAAPGIGLASYRWRCLDATLLFAWSHALRILLAVGFAICLTLPTLSLPQQLSIVTSMTMWLIVELWLGFRDQNEAHLWVAFSTLAAMAIFGMRQDWISVRTGTAPLLMVTFAFACLLAMGRIHHHTQLGFAASMLRRLGLTLPAIVFLLVEANTIFGWTPSSFALHGFALLSISALYFYQGLLHHQKPLVVAAGIVGNVALMQWFWDLRWHDLQLYLVPLGLSLIGLVEILRRELPISTHNPLRYVGALIVLVSPTFEIFSGSWLHLFSLLAFCLVIILLAIGLRLRALIYTGSAFLFADLFGMVLRSTVDHPGMLWIAGLGIGVTVIALAAACENQREFLLKRIRLLSAELATWS